MAMRQRKPGFWIAGTYETGQTVVPMGHWMERYLVTEMAVVLVVSYL